MRMTMRIGFSAVFVLFFSTQVLADGAVLSSDDVFQFWPYRRSLSIKGEAGDADWGAFPLRPDWKAALKNQGQDVRLLAFRSGNQAAHEVPFFVDASAVTDPVRTCSGAIVHSQKMDQNIVETLIDFGSPCVFDRLDFQVGEAPFLAKLSVEVADRPDGPYRLPVDPGQFHVLFGKIWNAEPLRQTLHTHVLWQRPVSARYLRCRFFSSNMALKGVRATLRFGAVGSRFSQPVFLGNTTYGFSQSQKTIRYLLKVPKNFLVVGIRVNADDAVFLRDVKVFPAAVPNMEGHDPRLLFEGSLYRLRMPLDGAEPEKNTVENLHIPLENMLEHDQVIVEMALPTGLPLSNLRMEWVGLVPRVLFPIQAGVKSWVFYHGNAQARAAVFPGMDALKTSALAGKVAEVETGKDIPNQLFQKQIPAPAPYVFGENVDVRAFRYVSALDPVDREDIYAVDLDPDDLAVLRKDLLDVRLVDKQDRAIPCVLLPSLYPKEFPLAVTKKPTDTVEQQTHMLTAPLGPRAAFFGRLEVALDEPLRLDGVQLLQQQQVISAEVSGDRKKLLFHLPEATGNVWHLVHRESLPIQNARMTISVPRLVCKLAPHQPYRLFLGAVDVRASLWQTFGLYQDFLARQASLVQKGPLQANGMYQIRKKHAWQGFSLFWVIGVFSLVGFSFLLWIALRLLRRK